MPLDMKPLESLNNPNNISYILLGALFTFIFTGIIEYLKNKFADLNKTKNFKLFIKLELSVIAKTLDKLNTGFLYGRYYDYALLDRIKDSISNLEKVRSGIIYLSNSDLKEKIVAIISDISTYIVMVKAIQQLFYDNQQKGIENDKKRKKTVSKKIIVETPVMTLNNALDIFNKSSTDKNIEFIEIKRKLEDVIKILDERDLYLFIFRY
jgi:hypothetical protein